MKRKTLFFIGRNPSKAAQFKQNLKSIKYFSSYLILKESKEGFPENLHHKMTQRELEIFFGTDDPSQGSPINFK